jgi:predicted DNA binding CopG/RHH family protein
LKAHKVTPGEFEQVLNSDPLDLDYDVIDGEGGYRSVGLTNGGRFILAVWTFATARCALLQSSRPAPSTGRLIWKNPMNKQSERMVPAFATEAEGAQWWYANRKIHDRELRAAVKSGEAKILTKADLRRRIDASRKPPAPVVALRIPAADLALARKQAEKKGLPYQTYIKSLLHETLTAREERGA